MKSFVFATIAGLLFLGSSALLAGSPVEESEDFASEETGQFCSDDGGDFSEVAKKKKKGKGNKGKKGSKKGKGKGKKTGIDGDEVFDAPALIAMDASYVSIFAVNADEEETQFASDAEDGDSFVSASKKKGKGKGKHKGKGKKGRGKGKKTTTDVEDMFEAIRRLTRLRRSPKCRLSAIGRSSIADGSRCCRWRNVVSLKSE